MEKIEAKFRPSSINQKFIPIWTEMFNATKYRFKRKVLADFLPLINLPNHGPINPQQFGDFGTLDSKTPYFSTSKDVLFCQVLERSNLSPTEILKIQVDRLARGFITECWEASRIPEPNYVYYFVRQDHQEVRLIHESDLYSGLDMRHVLSSAIRSGFEAKGVLNWRAKFLDHRQKILAAASGNETNILLQKTFCLLSPKKAANESNTPYTMSQFNAGRFLTPNLIEVKQWSQDFEPFEAAVWANSGVENGYLNPKASIYEIVTKVGISNRVISDQSMIDKAAKIKGKVRLTPNFQIKWTQAKKRAEINARIYLSAIKNGVVGEELNRLHTRLLLEVLEPFQETAAIRFSENGVIVETNCGIISYVNSSGLKDAFGREIIKCPCGYVNICFIENNRCNRCKRLLKPNFTNFTLLFDTP